MHSKIQRQKFHYRRPKREAERRENKEKTDIKNIVKEIKMSFIILTYNLYPHLAMILLSSVQNIL